LPLPPLAGETWLGRRVALFHTLPARLSRRLRELSSRPLVLHLLDQHYAYLRHPGTPSVLTCNGVFRKLPFFPRLPRFLPRTMRLAAVDRIVCVSNDAKADVEAIFHPSAGKISVAYYGVDPVFRPVGPRHEIPRRGSSKCLLHVGSNLPQKDVPTLLRALRIATDSGLDLKLVKVGDPIDSGEPAALLSALRLEERVVHLGKLGPEELASVYRACDAFVFPSTYEGFGRPIAEAQACQTPCILSDASCLPEIGGEGALYHRARDPDDLARRIEEMMRDPDLRASVAARGVANARRFSWDRHAEVLLEAYKGALSSRRS